MNESTNELQPMILQLYRENQKEVLKMDMNKTEVMFNNYMLNREI